MRSSIASRCARFASATLRSASSIASASDRGPGLLALGVGEGLGGLRLVLLRGDQVLLGAGVSPRCPRCRSRQPAPARHRRPRARPWPVRRLSSASLKASSASCRIRSSGESSETASSLAYASSSAALGALLAQRRVLGREPDVLQLLDRLGACVVERLLGLRGARPVPRPGPPRLGGPACGVLRRPGGVAVGTRAGLPAPPRYRGPRPDALLASWMASIESSTASFAASIASRLTLAGLTIFFIWSPSFLVALLQPRGRGRR